MKQVLSKVKLLYIESSKYDVNWHSTMHSHPFTEFFYVVSGKGYFKFVDGLIKNVNEDDLIIVNPNISHTEISDSENPLEYIVLGIEGIQFFTFEQNDLGYSIHNYKDYKHDILLYMKSILIEYQDQDPYQALVIKNLLDALIINIIRRTKYNIQIRDHDADVNKDSLFIKNYLDKHFREDISLDDLAELTFMNKYYLSHIFKEDVGKSPIQYILEKRVEEAKKMLCTTDLNISQISSILGFGTPAYFSQYFKKETSLSPSAYRKKYQN